MSKDTIYREDAIKVVSHVAMECIDRKTRIELINAIPSADSTEYKRGKEDEKRWWSEHCAKCTDADRPQGEWIETPNHTIKCSNCGAEFTNDVMDACLTSRVPFPRACPICMARMKGASDDYSTNYNHRL